MVPKIEIDHQRWEKNSPSEIGFDATGKIINHITHMNPDGLQIDIVDIDARANEAGPTTLVALPYNGHIDDYFAKQWSVFAHHTAGRVIGVGRLGETRYTDELRHTNGDKLGIKRLMGGLIGNSLSFSAAQIQAVDAEIGFEDGKPIGIAGESRANQDIAEWAYHLSRGNIINKHVPIARVDMIEPVNAHTNGSLLHPIQVARTLRLLERPLRLTYLAENDNIEYGDMDKVRPYDFMSDENKRIFRRHNRRQWMATVASGIGLRASLDWLLSEAMADKTNDGARLHEADITFWRAGSSKVSLSADIENAIDVVRQAGGNGRQVELVPSPRDNTKLGHFALESFRRRASFSEQYATNFFGLAA